MADLENINRILVYIMSSNILGSTLFTYVLLGMALLVCLKIYYESDAFQLKCIISSVDGNKYCVREREKMELAADLLAEVTRNCKFSAVNIDWTFFSRCKSEFIFKINIYTANAK